MTDEIVILNRREVMALKRVITYVYAHETQLELHGCRDPVQRSFLKDIELLMAKSKELD